MKTSDGFVKTTIAGIPYLLPYGQKIADHAHSPWVRTKARSYLCWRITTIQMLICSLSLPLT